MRRSWRDGSGRICERAMARGGSMRRRMRTVVSSLFYSVPVIIVPFPHELVSVGAEVELRAARGALANLVSGGTVSAPRSLLRVGGAPRRAAPLYVIGAVSQPTFHHGHRSLGPTRPVPPSGSSPICLSAFAGVPPAHRPPAVSCQAGFNSAPCGTAPSWRYRHSATRSFLASATIMTLRRRPREPPRRSWNQRESAQPGW